MASLSCDAVWLAWLQLPFGAVVFNVLASTGTLLVVVPVLSASSILSVWFYLCCLHTLTTI
jgi:hypothetical protein